MERIATSPRPDYGRKLEEIGLSFHSWDDYWKEDACYRFSSSEIDMLEAVTEELHGMCIEAVRLVIREDRFAQLRIPQEFHAAIRQSFERDDFSLYGRFDLAYDGKSAPKLLEYNADTPTSLLESAVAQWYWLQDKYPQQDQFNSLHERLVERWHLLGARRTIHFASIAGNEEDWVCTAYLMDTATQAGHVARRIDIEDIGWDEANQRFVDMENRPIDTLFKLYPWEWMMREEFGSRLLKAPTRFIEPIWKSLLACKGILPILWEMCPGHPNLLPAFFEDDERRLQLNSYAKKPLYSREGANIELHERGKMLAQDDGPYGAEGAIYQALHLLPAFGDRFAVIGSWIVGNQAAGMCVREDVSPITTNMSNFVPHLFTTTE
jgi:glutathionylspermidine synthase